MNENKDINCYFVTKISWKGKYKRIFSVGTHGITTYNPATLENTNQWNYNEFNSIIPNLKSQGNNEFVINIKKGKKADSMRFSSDHRADILTECLRFSNLFGEQSSNNKKFNAHKSHWSETKKPVILEITASCILQRDQSTKRILACYDYKDIDYIQIVNDMPAGFVISNNGFCRLHMFQCDEREQFFKSVLDYSANFTGISLRLKKEQLLVDQFWNEKFGKYSADEYITSLGNCF
jgi:DnaJ family protein C protein 13